MNVKSSGKSSGMQSLMYVYFVVAPLTFMTLSLAGVDIELSLIFAVLIGSVMLLSFISGRATLKRSDNWSLWFLVFLGFSLVSLLASPYITVSYIKGLTQILGISAVLLTSLYISRLLALDSRNLCRYTKVLTLPVTAIAILGIWQFVAYNILGLEALADFSFINRVFPDEWRDPGTLGNIRRTNALTAEPAHFARVLSLVGGIALLRLGLFGKSLSNSVATVVPKWAAIVVVAGFFISLSIIGYSLLILLILAVFYVLYRVNVRWLLGSVVVMSAMVGVLWSAVSLLGSGFANTALGESVLDKLGSISLIFAPITGNAPTSYETGSTSALALAANLSVALESLRSNPLMGIGLGGHPVAYEIVVPGWVRFYPGSLYGLNSEDAASLLIRLLSETGLIGTALFVGGWLTIVIRARTAIQKAIRADSGVSIYRSPILGISVGVTAAGVALPMMYLVRSGSYFDPPLWILLAMTASVPLLLNQERYFLSRLSRSESRQHCTGR